MKEEEEAMPSAGHAAATSVPENRVRACSVLVSGSREVTHVLPLACTWNEEKWLFLSLCGLSWWLRWHRSCLQCKKPVFDPWVGKIPWRREWPPTPVFLPGEFIVSLFYGNVNNLAHCYKIFCSSLASWSPSCSVCPPNLIRRACFINKTCLSFKNWRIFIICFNDKILCITVV